jgi:hypothetical protein
MGKGLALLCDAIGVQAALGVVLARNLPTTGKGDEPHKRCAAP